MPNGYRDHYFTNADGLRIHYRDYDPVGEVQGLPVICLHGLTRNVKDFEDIAPRIAKMGRRVISASQRGRGLSDYDPQPERYNPMTYAVDMVLLLDHLGLDRLVFVGTSMGGLMTMGIAHEQPERLAAVVLNDIGPVLHPDGIGRIKANLTHRAPVDSWEEAAERSKASNLAAFPKREHDQDYWIAFAKRLWREGEDGKLHLAYDAAIIDHLGEDGAPVPDLWPFYEALKDTPTLLVRGGITDLVTPQTVEEMKARKPDLRYAEVPDVGHAPMLDEPEAWSAIESLLAAVD
ncbi:alpha/beta fold hydrolase [Maricaulis sp. D1M11]|uniref:alpha/beta fold hydrolase n=1 Tax=Maricaulis sp. D1M11 TaxID=3076117 RepID=UPI0039B6E961